MDNQEEIQSEQIKRLLVPVDFSKSSRNAFFYALKVASKLNAEITFLHAFSSPAFDLLELTPQHGQTELRTQVYDELFQEAQTNLDHFVESQIKDSEATKKAELVIRKEVVFGIADQVILQFSKDYEPDLILMGTKGKNIKDSIILGSVTEKIIQKAHVPVWAVPEDYKFVGLENLQKIMYVTQFDESDYDAIKKLMRLIAPFDLSLHCVHLCASQKDSWEQVKMDGLRDYFKKAYGRDDVIVESLCNKDMMEKLDEYVHAHGINIISLATRKQSLLKKLFNKDLATRLFYHTSIPILVFHG
jgi:nucleotide-binding universal stress UspA family protein